MKIKIFKILLVGIVLITSIIGIITIIEIIFHYENIHIDRGYKCFNKEDANNTQRYLIGKRLRKFDILNEFHSASNFVDIIARSDKKIYLEGEDINISLIFNNTLNQNIFMFPLRVWWVDMKEKCIKRIYLKQISDYDMKDLYEPRKFENISYQAEPFCIRTIHPNENYIFKITVKNNCDPGNNSIEIRIDGLGKVESKRGEDGMTRIIWGITRYKPFYIEYLTEKAEGAKP